MPESLIGTTLSFDYFRECSDWLKVTMETEKSARYDLYDEDGNFISFYGTFKYKKISDSISTFSGSFKDGISTIKITDGIISGDYMYYNMVIDGYPYSGMAWFE